MDTLLHVNTKNVINNSISIVDDLDGDEERDGRDCRIELSLYWFVNVVVLWFWLWVVKE